MKQFLPFILTLFCMNLAYAQCDELFISEYVEGSSNNRALEIYNPTNRTINLSEYSVGRFRNGSNTFTAGQIPEGHVIEPDQAFVIVIDKRDSLGSGFETAVWNGYLLMEPLIDTLTGDVRLDNNGDTILFPIFDENLDRYLFGNFYREKFDLQSKADIFVNPVYVQATSFFYFNGNDAVALIKGSEVLNDGSNIIDVVGVIGEDPEVIYGTPYWTDGLGRRMTQNSTLVRDPFKEEGTGIVLTGRDTFPYGEWNWNFNNTFTFLGEHTCTCHDIVNIVEEATNSVEIYPNPVSAGTLQLNSDLRMENIAVFTLDGRFIESVDNVHSTNYSLDVSGYLPGLYFLEVHYLDGLQETQKIIIH